MKYLILVFFILFIGCQSKVEKVSDSDISNQDANQVILNEDNSESNYDEKVIINNEDDAPWFHPDSVNFEVNLHKGISIKFTPYDSIEITEGYLSKNVSDSIANEYDNSHLEALAIENYQNNYFGDYFKRDSSGLKIKLKNGDWKSVSLNSKYDEADNTFEYYFNTHGFFLIRVQWNEGNGYKLVNYETGEETRICGRPYFSPSGSKVICVNADYEAHYSYNGLQLYDVINNRLNLIGSYEPEFWGIDSANWIDENNLILKNETIQRINNNFDYIYFNTKLKINYGS